MAAIRDVALGRMAIMSVIADSNKETVGDPLDVQGAVVGAGDPRARAFAPSFPLRMSVSDPNAYANAQRLRRQIRAYMENDVARLQGTYYRWSVDPELNGWLLLGAADIKDGKGGGISTADWTLEISDAYLVGRPSTHRPARTLRRWDRRLSSTPRDFLGALYSTDFAAQTALPMHFLPVGVSDVLGTGRTVLTQFTRQTREGLLTYLTSQVDNQIVNYEQPELSRELGGVLIYDRRGSSATGAPVYTNLAPTPTFKYGLGTWSITSGGDTINDFSASTAWSQVPSGSSVHFKVTKDATVTARAITVNASGTGTAGIPVTPSTLFCAAAAVNIIDPWTTAGWRTVINWYQADGSPSSTPTTTGASVLAGGATGIAQVTVSGTVPADAAFARISIQANTNSTTPSDVGEGYIDAAQFHLGTATLPVYFDGDFTTSTWAGVQGASASYQWNTNLVPTPTFKYGTGAWANASGAGAGVLNDLSPSTVWSPAGGSSLHYKFTKDASATSQAITLAAVGSGTAAIPVVPGSLFVAAAQINVLDAWGTSGVRIRISWYKADGTNSATATTIGTPALLGTTGGAQITLTGTVAADAYFARVQVQHVASTTASDVGEGYIDQVQMFLGTNTPPAWDSTVYAFPPGAAYVGISGSMQDDLGWEEVYGSNQPLTAGDVPVLENGICRVRYNATTALFMIDAWQATTGYAEIASFEIWRDFPVGTVVQFTTLVAANVVEWTTERAVIRATFTGPGSQARTDVYLTLQRGWLGPRVEAYANWNGSPGPGVAIRLVPITAGASTLGRSSGTTTIVDGTDHGTFAAIENWLYLTQPGALVALHAAVLQGGVSAIGRADTTAYSSTRNAVAVTAKYGTSVAGYVSAQFGWGPAASASTDAQQLGQSALYDSRQLPELVARV